MIISRTPFRISFFGGGSDYPAWYSKYGGKVIGTTIDKYCYISCRYLPPFFTYKHRIVYSNMEYVNDLSEIKHPAVKGILETLKVDRGMEIHHDGDLPARSGLGSSSSFTVGLLHALHALHGKFISKRDLANEAVHIEQEVLKENVGSQDQILAAYGGFNMIEFHQGGTYDVQPVILPKERLTEFQQNLMLCFTGITRIASTIAKAHIDNLEKRKREIQMMQQMTHEAISILQSSSQIDEFGKLLHEYWNYKKSLSDKVTTPEVDEIYTAALEAGALGGKLLGAGGGGFMLFFAKPEAQQKIRERLKKLVHVGFRFEFSGSKIVIYEPYNF
ncbi:MAG TPA: kinase [Verrucomicrobiae bacterium]|jgi:D-glycero-alpha-D-manno-heptose-7-phosphate kinase|nr:kinase [Verrucomicrobiae bacterium]